MTEQEHGPTQQVEDDHRDSDPDATQAPTPVGHEDAGNEDAGNEAGQEDADDAVADPDADGQQEAAPVLSGTPSQRLEQLGLVLPAVPAPVAAYVPAVRSGAHVFTSGQLPFVDGVLPKTGVVGDQAVDVTPEEAAALARQCAVNALAAVASVVDLDSVVRVVKVTGFVASAPGFGGQPVVVDGASRLLGQVFGDAGRHARSAVGVAALPLGAPVEVEIVVEVG